MKFINDVDITHKRVFIRCDFNVPIDYNGNISDDRRIKETLPTINYAIDEKSKIILATHLGRPMGKENPKLSLRPIAKRLSTLLGKNVEFVNGWFGNDVVKKIENMREGDVILLENLRFHEGEENNSEELSKKLLNLFDVYVNDAFGVSHRKHASVYALPKLAKIAVGGFLLKKEIESFNSILNDPKRPLVAIIGGSKVPTKLGALKYLLNIVDKILIGGAMCFTFLKALDYDVGMSLVEEDLIDEAKNIIKTAKNRGVYLYLPVDFVISQDIKNVADHKHVAYQEIPNDWIGVDIGDATVKLFEVALRGVKSIVWNGPMGIFEVKGFDKGTKNIAKVVSATDAISIVGGGDTADAVERSGESENMTFISTGGGASLELLEGKSLPAIDVLEEK